MSITSQLVFLPAEKDDSANVGAYVRAGSDGDLIASQTIAAEEWLNVAAATHSGSGDAITSGDGSADDLATSFEGMDTRGFNYIFDGTNWDRQRGTAGVADVNVTNTVTVDANFSHLEDAAHVSGDAGSFSLSLRVDDLGAVPATALAGTELDYQAFITASDGALFVRDPDVKSAVDTVNVNLGDIETDIEATNTLLTTIDTNIGDIETILNGLSIAEDSIHVSGDQGIAVWGVRNDAGTPLAADGDYIPFSMTSTGALRVEANVTADIDDSLADTAIDNEATSIDTTVGGVAVTASALASRKWLLLANEGDKKMYYGKTGLTIANGFPLYKGQQAELRIGNSVGVFGITASGTADLRVMQLS